MNFYYHLYKESDLERWINNKYRDNGIHYASDMDIDRIACIFNVEVHTYTGKPVARWIDKDSGFDDAYILLHAYASEEEKRETFFHELCHPLQHVGCQDRMPATFMELQEIQAAHFQLYAAIPFFMLDEFKGINTRQAYIKVLSEEFKLPIPFVERRIDQIDRRINQERIDQDFIMSNRSLPFRYEYSSETLRLLDKLDELQAKRKGVV